MLMWVVSYLEFIRKIFFAAFSVALGFAVQRSDRLNEGRSLNRLCPGCEGSGLGLVQVPDGGKVRTET